MNEKFQILCLKKLDILTNIVKNISTPFILSFPSRF